jgi:predicted RNase H-like HicB family nuclease
MTKYTVVYTEETEGGFSGRCLELPGAISQGETLEELKVNITDAIQLMLASIYDIRRGTRKEKGGNRSFSMMILHGYALNKSYPNNLEIKMTKDKKNTPVVLLLFSSQQINTLK